jgi:hypothetical protein
MLLPEMPKELLDWDAERRIIMFPWDAPVRMVPFGPDKAPWRGVYRRRMITLETTTLCCKGVGAFGTLYTNLVVNDNGETEDRDRPNMHLGGYGDMYLDVHFEVYFPSDNETPKNAILDPHADYDDDGRWPKDLAGKPVPPEDPRIPRWARPYDEVANGGFPIPEYLIDGIAAQLAHKKHRVPSPLMHLGGVVPAQIVELVRRQQPKSDVGSGHAGHAGHVDAADLAAQTARNVEEAERQRGVRRQAKATAAARQLRAYSTAGPSHREGAPRWGDEVPDAGDRAKSDANRAASKEAKAKRRADKKAAARAELEHRVWQFEQIRTGEAIGSGGQ